MTHHHLFKLRQIKKLTHAYIFEFIQMLPSDHTNSTMQSTHPPTLNKSFLYTSMIRLKISDPSTEKPYTPFHLFAEGETGSVWSETDEMDARMRRENSSDEEQEHLPRSGHNKRVDKNAPKRLVVRYLVKIYHGGHMGQYWTKLQIADEVLIRFIAMRCTAQNSKYCGSCTGESFERVGIICGGTGISSCWQYLNRMKRDGQSVDMIAAYNTLDEVVMEPEHQHPYYEYERVVKELASKGVHFFATVKEAHVVSVDHTSEQGKPPIPHSTTSTQHTNPHFQWKGGHGLITRDMIRIMLPSPRAQSVKIIVCGPPPMIRFFCGNQCADSYMKRLYEGEAVEGYETPPLGEESVLHALGYSNEQVVIL